MKIRTGFVSNSSSSSFLIAYKKLKNGPTLVDFIEGSYSNRNHFSETGVGETGFKDCLNKLEYYFGGLGNLDVFEFKNFLKTCIFMNDVLKNGYADVAWVEISYHDDEAHDILSEQQESGDIKVLYTL